MQLQVLINSPEAIQPSVVFPAGKMQVESGGNRIRGMGIESGGGGVKDTRPLGRVESVLRESQVGRPFGINDWVRDLAHVPLVPHPDEIAVLDEIHDGALGEDNRLQNIIDSRV